MMENWIGAVCCFRKKLDDVGSEVMNIKACGSCDTLQVEMWI